MLSALDGDTRDYLQLLISGAGKGLKGRGTDLQETFARLGPLNRDLGKRDQGRRAPAQEPRRTWSTSTASSRRSSAPRTGRSCGWCRRRTPSSRRSPPQDTQISDFVSKLPGALGQTEQTLAKVDTLGGELGPTLEALRPPFRKLDTANRAVLPFVREATPQLRDQIRPFARIAGPYTADLGTAARDLNKANPDLTTSFNKLNRLFNIGAFNPNGAEGLTGDIARDRAREEGYLYWLAWTAQNTVSLFSTADARARSGGSSWAASAATRSRPAGRVPPLPAWSRSTACSTPGGSGACAI